MIDKDKAMLDFVNACTRLNFEQLLIAQANLSEHINNCFQYNILRKEHPAASPQDQKH